jgi:hypothetical protein
MSTQQFEQVLNELIEHSIRQERKRVYTIVTYWVVFFSIWTAVCALLLGVN